MAGVRDLADRYLDRLFPLDPYLATTAGERAYDDQLTDYSADGVAARADLARETLAELARTEAADDADRLCGALLRERLGAELGAFDAGEHLLQLRIFESPVSAIREVFDLAPRTTDDDWANIAARMAAVPEAYRRFETALRASMASKLLTAPRQALAYADRTTT